jgi:hypothetical protein
MEESGRACPPSDQQRGKGAVPRLVPYIPTVEALSWESAFGVHVVTGEAVEALPDQVGWDQPMWQRDSVPIPPAAPTENLPCSV